jgi:hypothetical protein
MKYGTTKSDCDEVRAESRLESIRQQKNRRICYVEPTELDANNGPLPAWRALPSRRDVHCSNIAVTRADIYCRRTHGRKITLIYSKNGIVR